MSDGPQKLDASLLRRVVPLDDLSFENTAQLPPSEVIIGQERALSAIRLGIGMHGPGFNVFAVGLAATGRQATVRRIFDEIKPRRRRRRDFVFVANLENPARPRLLVLPAGRGELLRKELWELRERLRVEVRRVLESEPLRKKRDRASHEQEVITRQLYGDMEERCLDLGLLLGIVRLYSAIPVGNRRTTQPTTQPTTPPTPQPDSPSTDSSPPDSPTEPASD